MSEHAIDASQSAADPMTLERDRIKGIIATARDYPDIQSRAIEECWSVDQTNTAVLNHMRASRPHIGISSGIGASLGTVTRATIETALLLRLGRDDLAVKAYGEGVVHQARAMREPTLLDVCSMALRLDGRPSDGLTTSQLIRAGFSTVSLPDILSNVTGKALVAAYEEGTASWKAFADVRSATSFQVQTAIRPSVVGQLERLGPAGEIKHLTLGEQTIAWSVDTWARMLQLTRQMMVNDDLGVFAQMAPMLGGMAARSVNELVWRTLMSGSGTHFSVSRGNILEAGSALSVESLGAAITLMRKQRDASDQDISIIPRVLAVPPELETTARGILNSQLLGTADGSPTGNPLQGVVELVVESRLSNPLHTGNSATAWYLFGGPASVPFIVGYLREQSTPVVEAFGLDHEVETLGFSWRVYFDFGAALGDYRAAVKATGAAT